jgi:hypothetical protein
MPDIFSRTAEFPMLEQPVSPVRFFASDMSAAVGPGFRVSFACDMSVQYSSNGPREHAPQRWLPEWERRAHVGAGVWELATLIAWVGFFGRLYFCGSLLF